MKKVYPDATAALAGLLRDDMTIVAGGFGLCGIPENLIDAIMDSGVKGLTVVSNNCGVDGWGLGKLLDRRQIKKMVSSYVGENKEFERQSARRGPLGRVEFNPQGTLADRLRAAVARRGPPLGLLHQDRRRHAGRRGQGAGRPGVGRRDLRHGARHRRRPGDLKAWQGDHAGNLVYRKTARNFNPVAATAGKVCVAEVEHLVAPGALDPDHIHTFFFFFFFFFFFLVLAPASRAGHGRPAPGPARC